MLFFLTGDVQTGKTRWLEGLVERLAAEGVECCGVIAPGVWRPRKAAPGARTEPSGAGKGAYEKRGIENVLLPEGTRIPFARRREVAERDGSLNPSSQSAKAGLAWEISDGALARVNRHFDALALTRAPASAGRRPGLLVVDELGRLELERGGGLTSAVALLERGASARFPHALVVVRAWLLGYAEGLFADSWGGCASLAPGDGAEAAVRAAFGLATTNDNEYH